MSDQSEEIAPPERPDGVPEAAEWDEDDREWVLGSRDDEGEFHGDVHYYRPDGTLCSIAHYVHGTVEGKARRFHPNGDVSQIANYRDGLLHGTREWFASAEPTPEAFYTPGMSRDIVRAEVEYVDGKTDGFSWFLADGTQVEADGSPIRTTPDGVPVAALWRADRSLWFDGDWDDAGRRVGVLRSWFEDGTRAVVEHYEDNVANGPTEVFRRDDGTLLTRQHYVDGELSGPIEYFYRTGTLARRVDRDQTCSTDCR